MGAIIDLDNGTCYGRATLRTSIAVANQQPEQLLRYWIMRTLIKVISIVVFSIFVVAGSQVAKALQHDKKAEAEFRKALADWFPLLNSLCAAVFKLVRPDRKRSSTIASPRRRYPSMK